MVNRLLGLCLATLAAAANASEAVEHVRIGEMVLQGIPQTADPPAWAVSPYLEYRSARLLGWLGDGVLIRTRFGATDQLHRVDQPLGARRQLTFFAEPVRSAVTSGKRLVYLKDTGGDEQYQLFQWQPAGHPEALTPAGARSGSPVFSLDGDHLAFNSNARDGVHWDIWISQLSQGKSRRLTTTMDGAAWYPLSFSADNTHLLLQQYRSITDSQLWLLELESERLWALPIGSGPIGIAGAAFDLSGDGVLVSADLEGEYRQLYRVGDNGQRENLSAHIPWDITDFAQSDDGRLIAMVSNEDGRSRISLIDQRARMELTPPALPTGVISGLFFEPGGHRLALSLQSATSPADIWVLEWTPKPEWVRWTASEAAALDLPNLAQEQLIHFESFDGLQVPAFVYAPKTPGPHPVVVLIHGGPESQFRAGFRADVQFLVKELGFAVVAPNVRGSAGYGKRYLQLDNGGLRKDSVKDIGALLDWLATQPGLDEHRTVVMGGSYGGYMVLASLVDYSDRLLGGIDRVGISNFVTFLENTSPYRQELRRAEYGDERDPEMRRFLESIAPLNHVDRIGKPLLVLQGANDPRVPQSESEQMVTTIRNNGGEVWYLLALNEGHGLRRKANQRVYLETVGRFLTHLIQ
ncbi:MAG: S9 family peptidase [Gammaproteobacteria bacterium]